MYPYIDLFGLEIPTYGLISIMGAVLAFFIGLFLAKKRSVNKDELLSVTLFGVLGMFIGAHLLYGLTRVEDIIAVVKSYDLYDGFLPFVKDLWNYMNGMVFFGGLYGGLVAGCVYISVKKLPLGEYADVFAVIIPFFHIFGRVGCFFAGCCYGVEMEGGIAGRVLSSGAKEHIERLPVQLIEAGVLFLLSLVLFLLFMKNILRGRLVFMYLVLYSVARFMLEFFRGDEIRGGFLWFSTSQWISIITLIWAGGYLLYVVLRNRKEKLTSE
ncbi:MAG: prolipoprotein diacylglyceryl transferase [Ruminococcus sp.]|nr:prolipoprotein diacylglyceryl transferase [Ruminococcus sp.]